MYYDRSLSKDFEKLFNDVLSWLVPYVKSKDDLDILIGKNNNLEYCYVYRGLSKIVAIEKRANNKYNVTASDAYNKLGVDLYGDLDEGKFNENSLEKLRQIVARNKNFDRYYNNRKEGYFQNKIQRDNGILATRDTTLLIVDKEVVIGYKDTPEKEKVLGEAQKKYMECKMELQKSNLVKFGRPSKNMSGNELDLLALDRSGRIYLMEVKYGGNTAGIYMSPFQIGLYKRLFKKIDIRENVKKLIEQKQRMGLLPKDWVVPDIKKGYVPELIIGAYNPRSCGYPQRYNEVMDYIQKHDPEIYNEVCDIQVKDENLRPIR